jgi:hypothetical protein
MKLARKAFQHFVFAPILLALSGHGAWSQTNQVLPGADVIKASFPSRAPIVFFLAKGELNVCGQGCNEWIAAEGDFDAGAAERFRRFLSRIGPRRLPIFFHSFGGQLGPGVELGRLIRRQKMVAGVARTTPVGCTLDNPRDKSCEALKRSGQELVSEFDTHLAWCSSACLDALTGGVVRLVPPDAIVAIHAIGRHSVSGSAIEIDATARQKAVASLKQYYRDMGIDAALVTEEEAVPNESVRNLRQNEIVQFGIDTREFGETAWRFSAMPITEINQVAAMMNTYFVRADNRTMTLLLSCGEKEEMDLRILVSRYDPLGSILFGYRIDISDWSVELPYVLIYLPSVKRSSLGRASLPITLLQSLKDNSQIEISAIVIDQRLPVPLSMTGFSAAYAKLSKACEETRSSPGTMIPAPTPSTSDHSSGGAHKR